MRPFPRGSGPLISVLIPTRGRPSMLAAAMDSCLSLAFEPRNIEFILKIDDDDHETAALAFRMTGAGIPVRSLVSPRGRGYLDMHLWATEMSRMARGDWLFLFNDDATITTQDWDRYIANASPDASWHRLDDLMLLILSTIGSPLNTEFLIARKTVIDLLGHWALSPHNDTWLVTVMRNIGSALWVPSIRIKHHNQLMDDDTRKDVLDCMAPNEGASAYNTVENIRARLEDTQKLLDYIEARLSR